ncbi:MAG TPA: MFS transporter [Ramlibacter sp.]|uniref:MFS transporter n=1 Tax=Ramlibacter sp. TaxID=1917967 RepID=UPI002CE47441|nr:MFS transporter [Ramlibacter sp.]HVZ42237.1 MFS transporter [Ramlibacter sp.]
MQSPIQENPDTPEAGGIAALRQRYGERYRWILLGSVMVGTMASIMSSTIVNVAIPDMSRHFALGQESAQWVSSGFMVASTVGMLTTPWMLARFGYRRTYVMTMLLLMAGGIAGGVASEFWLILAARVAEGLSAGIVQPIPAIIMLRAFEPHEQGRASSLFGMGVVLAPAIGPSIGGLLVDWFGWRSIFFMVVPFCIASLYLAFRFVPVTSPGGGAAQRDAQLDWPGLALGAAGTLCLLNGLIQLRGTSHGSAVALLAGAAAAVVAFIAWQKRRQARGGSALMNLKLFTHRTYAMGTIVSFIYGTALFGSTYLLPIYMLLALELPAAHVGTIMLPSGIALALTIGAVGRITHRVPTHVLVSVGLAMLGASFVLMPTVPLQAPLVLLVTWVTLGRVGFGFILPSLNIGSMRTLDKTLIPHGASAINFLRMLGGATGVSLCAIVLEWRIAAHGDSLANPATSAARLAAFDESFWMLAGLCGLALLAAWQLKDRSPAARSAQ